MILVHFDKFPEGSGSPAEIGKRVRGIDVPGTSSGKVFQKGTEGKLRLVEDQVVHMRVFFGICRKERTSGNDLDACRLAPLDDLLYRFLLNCHGSYKHIIRPLKVLILQTGDIHVHESLFPFPGQHRGHGQKAQRRVKGPFRYELQGMFETPEGVGVSRIHQKYVHPAFLS